MTYYQHRVSDASAGGDRFDRILAVAFIVSEVALDVFGMLFWSGLALCLLKVATQG